jgi:hypothetical protein
LSEKEVKNWGSEKKKLFKRKEEKVEKMNREERR